VRVVVEVSGSYVADEQFYVTGFDGATQPYTVVTPLLTATGAAVLVVRGSTAVPPAEVPSGQVAVEGLLQPSMDEGSAIDADRVAEGIRISSLIGDFDEDLYSGFIVATSSQPDDTLTPVKPSLPDPSRWVGIRNLIYALQWWLFAGFVAFMWWRIAHEDDDETPADVG
jgi:cytochrome oxidase assembly protein ShyY1